MSTAIYLQTIIKLIQLILTRLTKGNVSVWFHLFILYATWQNYVMQEILGFRTF